MITLEIFLSGLILISTITGLVTEGVKKVLTELNKTYNANILSGIVSVVISGIVGCGYVIATQMTFTASAIISLVSLVVVSWLCAMIGYDKVIQAINQFKKK